MGTSSSLKVKVSTASGLSLLPEKVFLNTERPKKRVGIQSPKTIGLGLLRENEKL